MRYEKYRKIICDCRPEGIGYSNEAVLYFCEFFDRYAKFYSVYPEIILVLRGSGQDDIKIPVKHKEDIIKEKDFHFEEEVMGRKEGEALVIPYLPEGSGAGSPEGIPVLISGRCREGVREVTGKGLGLYYNDYFEFEAGLEYLLSKESAFRREVT